MRKACRLLTIGVIILAIFAIVFISCNKKTLNPPIASTGGAVDTLHGNIIPDPYRWLEDQNSPQTREWIKQQNDYAAAYFAGLGDRTKLKNRYLELARIEQVELPWQAGNRLFYEKMLPDQELSVLYVREGIHGEDKVLLDPHTMSTDLSKTVDISDISDDGRIMAYQIRDGGADETIVKIMNVDTREHFPEELPLANYFGFAFNKDMSGFYYSQTIGGRGKIFYHQLGTDISEDKMIFGEGFSEDKFIGVNISENRRWLMITVYHGSSGNNDVYVADLDGDKIIKPLIVGLQGYFEGLFAENDFILSTSWKSPNGRILKIDINKPDSANWTEIVPEREFPISGFSLAGGNLYVNYLENVAAAVAIFDINGTAKGALELPTLGDCSKVFGKWNSTDAFYSFESFHYPKTIFHLDITSGTPEIWHKANIPVDINKFEVKQVWYESKDGTKIPMFVVHAKDFVNDGNHMAYLYGYGGFRSNSTPYFSKRAVIIAEQGGVYAYPAIRGGSEFGEKWHEAAMFEKKQNSFDDFIAAAEYLINNQYTIPSRLTICGGSNGGLLVGACMNQRPELFGAVVCTYPLLDMLRYHKLLMGPYWISEYGSADVPSQFEYIHAYSPYHNVKKDVKYPAVLFITGDFDTRVDPMHARKMTALLQAEVGSERPVILMYDTKSGHVGGKTMSQYIDEFVDEQSFMFHECGVK